MRYPSLKLLAWSSLLAVSVAVPNTPYDSHASAFETTTAPIPPSLDPFYTAPNGFETKTPGAVLKIRPAPGNLTATFNASASVFNILSRTTNSHYQPAWAVTTLFVPSEPARNVSNPLLSYQVPYNTADVDGSPS